MIVIYHVCLLLILFFLAVGGGSVQNDAYKRLRQFMSLEQDHQLKEAKENPQKFDSMFQIDLKKFENSNEFRESLKIQDIFIDQVEAVSIGWLFVLLAELAIAFVGLMHYATALFKRNIKSGF